MSYLPNRTQTAFSSAYCPISTTWTEAISWSLAMHLPTWNMLAASALVPLMQPTAMAMPMLVLALCQSLSLANCQCCWTHFAAENVLVH
jgi:hypothetical protein